jgi:hypothetical protein
MRLLNIFKCQDAGTDEWTFCWEKKPEWINEPWLGRSLLIWGWNNPYTYVL